MIIFLESNAKEGTIPYGECSANEQHLSSLLPRDLISGDHISDIETQDKVHSAVSLDSAGAKIGTSLLQLVDQIQSVLFLLIPAGGWLWSCTEFLF